MRLQGRHLTFGMEGEDVALLQQELQQLGFSIAEEEVARRFFGESTREAVTLFQRQHGLEPATAAGVVDEPTAQAINAAQPHPSFIVNGVIRWQDGTVAPHLAVRAVDKDLRSEELLGETTTSESGFYEIAYTADQFARSEKHTADLIVRVFDHEGVQLGASDIVFNAPAQVQIDLVVAPPERAPLSEYEALLAELSPVLQGVPPHELDAVDITFLVGETGLPRERVEFLAQGARLAVETNLLTEVFYGLARQGFPLDLDALLANDLVVLRDALKLAITNHIIPVRLLEVLDAIMQRLEELRFERSLLVPHEFTGRLIDQDTDEPLAGFTVHAFDLDAGSEALGSDVTDGNGLFAFTYFAPRSTPPEEDGEEEERGHRLRLHVIAPDGGEIHQAEVLAPEDQQEVIDIPVPVPETPAPPSPPLEELDETLQLQLPEELLSHLADKGITTLADIRLAGGIRHIPDLPIPPDHPAVRTLEAHARLGALSDDIELNQQLIGLNLSGPPAIAHTPRTDFVRVAHVKLGDFKAARTQVDARARAQFLSNVIAALRADRANGFPTLLGGPSPDSEGELADLFPPTCGCRDCDAAVSPLAYLAELLDYAVTHLKQKDGDGAEVPVSLANLGERFHQPFGDLPASCEEVGRKVRQVRVCIEVLRRYLAAAGLPASGTPEAEALMEATRAYLVAAYTALLTRIGTSFAEIRLASTADPEERDAVRQALADRLGIPLDRLDRLLLDPEGTSADLEPLTEEALERLFGLADTARDPLSEGGTRGDDQGQIIRWNLDGTAWNQHTDPDGTMYVRLMSPAAGVVRVELFRDMARTERVASGEQTVPDTPVSVAAEDGSDLTGRFEINFLAETAGIELVAVPQFLSWRLQYLRALWLREDWPADPYADGAEARLPVIDPDVIGPDDLRNPQAGNAAFDLWLKRRAWVDDRLSELAGLRKMLMIAEGITIEVPDVAALFARMYQPVTYDTVEVSQAWADTTPPEAFDALRDGLVGGTTDEVRAITQRLREDLRLTVEAFSQLMAIRDKAVHWEADPNSEPVTNEEWHAFFSILVQAQKQALYPTWIDEERDQNIGLDPKYFWISLQEPEVGDWPPLRPLIDPETLGQNDLVETVGQSIIELLGTRRAELDTIRGALQDVYAASGFEAMLRQALGHPEPGNPLQHDLDSLYTGLNSGNPAGARAIIERDLHMTVDDFKRLMDVRAKTGRTAEELASVFAILTTARKRKHEYDRWRTEEQEADLTYWNIFKTRLPRWRASTEARQTWQQALLRRGQAPLIDPDLVRSEDLRDPLSGDAAELWQSRRDFINAELEALGTVRDAPAFDESFENVVGVPASELNTLAEQRAAGEDIAKRLAQLHLTSEAFDYLGRIRRLAGEGAPVLPEEWENVAAILVQVRKQREFASWREEERERGITLGPDDFKIPEPPPLVFPPPEPEPLPAWRATEAARRAWQDTLRSRIEQEQTAIDALQAAVSATEEEVLPQLRDALTRASDAAGITLEAQAKDITDKLLIDARNDGCQMTSRVAQAIETLQLLLWSVRTGQLQGTHPDLVLDDDHFDEAWQWLGSYETWRAAMLVFLYPENILLPSLRKWQTPAFRQLVDATRANTRLTPEDACTLANTYADYFRDVCTLTLEASVVARTDAYAEACRARAFEGDRHLVYLFASGGTTKTVYYSRYNPKDTTPYAQSFWAPVPGLERGSEVIGAAAYAVPDGKRLLYLFARVGGADEQTLVYTTFDLAQDRWAGEAYDLELPEEAKSFTAAVKQRHREDEPPHVAIQVPGGAMYERHLNRAGSGWEGGDWQPLVGRAKGSEFSEIHEMIEPARDEYYLIARHRDGSLYYRLFLKYDDGRWRPLDHGVGPWLGGFPWPGTDHIYAFWRQGAGSRTRYVSLERSSQPLTSQKITRFEDFDNWLKAVTGLSLAGLVIEDSTPFSEMNLLQFFTLSSKDLRDLGKAFGFLGDIVIEELYRLRGRTYIEKIAGQLENEDDPSWKEWKLADDWIRQLTLPSLSFQDVLIRLFRTRLPIATTVTFDVKRRNDEQEKPGQFRGLSGLNRIVLGSGEAPADLEGRVTYHQKTTGLLEQAEPTAGGIALRAQPIGLPDKFAPRVAFVRSHFVRAPNRSLTPTSPTAVAPFVTEPFEITERLSPDALQVRRHQIRRAFQKNTGTPASVLIYLEEAYYFVPVHLAVQLQQRGQYTAALDWFRTVYDYSVSVANRKISHYLKQEESLEPGYARIEAWWLDPLNPHAIASTRAHTYTRFTLLSLVRCFLAFADAEFTRDTAESLPRARTLYMTALELLDLPELKQQLNGCDELIGVLDVEVRPVVEAEDLALVSVLDAIKASLRHIRDRGVLEGAIAGVKQQILGTGNGMPERLATARRAVAVAIASQPASPRLLRVLAAKNAATEEAHDRLLRHPVIAKALTRLSAGARTDYVHAVSAATSISVATLETNDPEDMPLLPWLRERDLALGNGVTPLTDGDGVTPALVGTATLDAPMLARIARVLPLQAVEIARTFKPSFIPTVAYSFCVPPNPIIAALRLHTELNLHKLRTCRNIAGDERQLEPYAASIDVESGLPAIGAGGALVLPGTITLQPTPYRYAVLIERAKQLVSLAQQIEAAFLSTLEKRDAEYLNLLKARQDIRLARSGVRLQDLRVKEAEDGVRLAELQRERAQIQVNHFQELLAEGRSALEEKVLDYLRDTIIFHLLAAAASFSGAANPVNAALGGTSSSVASGFSSLAAATSTAASYFQFLASLERLEQEWQLQHNLARQDVRIGNQQIRLAQDHVRVVAQERTIAAMQVDHAEVTADFLANKFTNVELYDWMSGVLEGVYRFFLQQATAMAQLAANQLAFERQEVPPPFILADYWEAPMGMATGGNADGTPPDRRGLTGSTRLLQDIFRLDQYAFETDKRKLQLTKTISLARLAPAEFQRFRENGVLRFDTPMVLFDRDFPGHYLRLIKRIRTSVIALIPPTQGINAILSTTGLSRVVIGGNGLLQTVQVRRPPESIALSSPVNATGLFELTPQTPEMLFPFEGMGVDTAWEFQMPKASNLFDYSTIADVLLSIEYAALNSFTYRQQVIRELDRSISADRPFSFRQELADQFYDLNNPEQTDAPMVVRFTTRRADFPPNLAELRIQHVVLFFARAEGTSFEVPVTHLRFTEQGSAAAVGGGAASVDGVISTRRGNAGSWTAIIGKSPIGEWELALPNTEEVRNRFKNDEISDILFVITHSGLTPAWPA